MDVLSCIRGNQGNGYENRMHEELCGKTTGSCMLSLHFCRADRFKFPKTRWQSCAVKSIDYTQFSYLPIFCTNAFFLMSVGNCDMVPGCAYSRSPSPTSVPIDSYLPSLQRVKLSFTTPSRIRLTSATNWCRSLRNCWPSGVSFDLLCF